MENSVPLQPFSKFKARFVNSHSFIGTCSLRDVCNFLHVHAVACRYVLWIDIRTGHLVFSYLIASSYCDFVQIINTSVVPSSSRTSSDFSYYCQWYPGYSETCNTCIKLVTWFSSKDSVFGELMINACNYVKSELLMKIEMHMRVAFPPLSVIIGMSQYNKHRHVCLEYYKHKDERPTPEEAKEMTEEELFPVCIELKVFNPQSLKDKCLFFIANYWRGKKRFTKSEIPYFQLSNVNRAQSLIGKTGLLRDKSAALKINFSILRMLSKTYND